MGKMPEYVPSAGMFLAANSSRPTGSLRQRQKHEESQKEEFHESG